MSAHEASSTEATRIIVMVGLPIGRLCVPKTRIRTYRFCVNFFRLTGKALNLVQGEASHVTIGTKCLSLLVPVGNLRPNILMVKSAQDRHRQRLTDGQDRAWDRCILLQ